MPKPWVGTTPDSRPTAFQYLSQIQSAYLPLKCKNLIGDQAPPKATIKSMCAVPGCHLWSGYATLMCSSVLRRVYWLCFMCCKILVFAQPSTSTLQPSLAGFSSYKFWHCKKGPESNEHLTTRPFEPWKPILEHTIANQHKTSWMLTLFQKDSIVMIVSPCRWQHTLEQKFGLTPLGQ